ncbi:hypothetical protein JTE90_017045 [Oedothorax gibbosus]|uniref:Uncharacterized protein n=1 Tax=Oedothorax gibbosus TaxID=931172 RepID=A0AAV6UN12_9ARAC|nr:hypothetical protein JTE90_017045 [Oedothorax gibbosus]
MSQYGMDSLLLYFGGRRLVQAHFLPKQHSSTKHTPLFNQFPTTRTNANDSVVGNHPSMKVGLLIIPTANIHQTPSWGSLGGVYCLCSYKNTQTRILGFH